MGRLGSGRDAQTNLRLGSAPRNQPHQRSPAASDIRQYFDALEGLTDRVAKEGTYEGRRASHTLAVYYTDEFLAECQAHLDRAKEQAGEDEAILGRIAFLQTGLQFTRVNRDRLLAREAMRAGTGDRAAYEAADKALADYYQEMGITWAVNSPYLKFYGF